jgi:lactonase
MVWTVTAERYMPLQGPHPVADIPTLEGPSFAEDGSLIYMSVHGDEHGNRLFRADLESRSVEPLYADQDSNFAGTAVHRDGRIFIADLGLVKGGGRIACFMPGESVLETVVSEWQGAPIFPDDLVFDAAGNLYFNDMQGNVVDPTGKVLRLSTDGEVAMVCPGLAAPNGIAFDESVHGLWTSEHFANRLVKLELGDDGLLSPGLFPGASVRVYTHLSGGEVDSVTADADGNVYAAMYRAGRVDVVDNTGTPVGAISLGEDARRFPNASHVVIRPDSTEAFLLSAGPEGAMLFSFDALAPAQQLFAQSTNPARTPHS